LVDQDDSGVFDDELVEIERASAILHQRDPDQAERVVSELRARRAEEQRRAQTAARIRQAAEKKRRVRRLRIGIVAGVLVVAGIAAVPLTQAILDEAARVEALQTSLNKATKPMTALGFGLDKEWLDVPSAGVVFEAPRNTCSVVVGVAEGDGKLLPVRIERDGFDPAESEGGLIWCSCDKQTAKAKFVNPPEERLALRWLNAKMGSVGGIEVLSELHEPGFSVTLEARAYGCADAAFATWAQGDGHGRLDEVDERQRAVLEPLKAEQFGVLGLFPKNKRFAVVQSRPDRCYLALPFGEKAPLTLRNTEGRRLVEDSTKALGWCTYGNARAFSLWRKNLGTPDLLVLEVLANRVGGLTGLREGAARHGAREIEAVLENEDLGPDAVAALLASGVGESTIVRAEDRGLPGKPDSRVVAFGLFDTSSFLPDVAPPVPVACEPKVVPNAAFQTYVCVQARPQRWRREGSIETQGAAEGRLPFWLSMLADMNERRALDAVAEMLIFSRRMTLLGFEPTTTDGVKDSAFGGEVLGRPDKTEALAVGLTKHPPWFHPLTRGPAWKLDGHLPMLKIKLGESVKVRSLTGSLGADPNDRRVVVWRR
jgi:hypothetical protein